MRLPNKVIAVICMFVLAGFGLTICATEPNEREIQQAAEKMQRLREVYPEVQEAEEHLRQVTKEAENEQPSLIEVKKALKQADFLYGHGLVGERERYHAYLKTSKDPNAIKRLFLDCRAAFSVKEQAEALRDPNQEKTLKVCLIPYYRYEVSKRAKFLEQLAEIPSFTVFDPNDPNDERLWQNIKRFMFEAAEFEKAEQRKLIEEKGVPEWLADYAGKEGFAILTQELYFSGVYMLTPQKVRDAEERVNRVYHKMGGIYPHWDKMRHLLAGNDHQ